MSANTKKNILGVSVDATNYESAVECIMRAARDHQPFAATALAVHGVMTGVLDAEHRFRLNSFDLVVPDGQPVRWALNWLHQANLKDRVYGPNLTLRVFEKAEVERVGVYLFGATEEVLRRLREKLLVRFPRLKIVGYSNSRFR